MQSAIEYAAIPTINLTPLFLVTNPLTNSSQSEPPVNAMILLEDELCMSAPKDDKMMTNPTSIPN